MHCKGEALTGAVADVAADVDAKVAADGAGRGGEGVGSAKEDTA